METASARAVWERLWRVFGAHVPGVLSLGIGKTVLLCANAGLMLVMVHYLTLPMYGLLLTVVGAQLLLSRVLLAGTHTALVRMRMLPELCSDQQEVFQAGVTVLRYTTGAALVLVLLMTLVHARVLPRVPLWVIGCVLVGGIGTALVDYGYAEKLAELRYRGAAWFQGGTAVARLVCGCVPALLGRRFVPAVFVTYPLVNCISGWLNFQFRRRPRPRPRRSLVRYLLRYSKWEAASDCLAVLASYEGAFLLTLLSRRADAGLFGFALTLSLGFFVVRLAVAEYILPQVSQVHTVDMLPGSLFRAFQGAMLAVAACVPVVIGIALVLPRVVRPELRAAVPVFLCLSAAMLVSVLRASFDSAALYLLRPHFHTLAYAVLVICGGVVGLILTPAYGALGMAVGQAAGAVAAFFICGGLVMSELRSLRAKALTSLAVLE